MARNEAGYQTVHAGVDYIAYAQADVDCWQVLGYRLYVNPEGEVHPEYLAARDEGMIDHWRDREPVPLPRDRIRARRAGDR